MSTICLAIETTGLDRVVDEILQLSIIDENENILYNQYFAPEWKAEWPEAMAVNHIIPEMLAGKPHFKDCLPQIQSIIDDADTIVTYNGEWFDIPMLEFKGIKFPEDYQSIDVKQEYAEYMAIWNEKVNGWKWWKLTEAAKYFKIEYRAHDSLEDTQATLEVRKRMEVWKRPLDSDLWKAGDRIYCPSYEKMHTKIKQLREAGIEATQGTEPMILIVREIHR
ncbi:MAG: 3'-5' exonuclease [Lachnospiraceae bacterium]|nr:3'-5' exonuclease [Lachnospiraceae bacterium]